jgi:tripartite-type tricarboxylate transporter receptor subunit TctC
MPLIRSLFLGAALVALSGGAFAQAYPSQPIKLIVPFPPAGSTDLSGRAVAGKLQERLGQPVVIENKPGAGGNIGSDLVAKAQPDGYTLLVGTIGTHAINMALYSKMPYDNIRDFAPVVLLSSTPNVLVVYPEFPAHSVADLIRLAKADPGKITYGSSGSGTSIHLSGVLFNSMAGTEMTHVPYKGSAGLQPDLMSGTINIAFDNLTSTMAQIKGGRLRAIAVTGRTRSPMLPDLPTIAESGLPGYEVTSWNAVFAPAGTPKEIIDRLNHELNAILQSPETRKYFAEQGGEAGGGTPRELADLVRSETAKWSKVVKESGARVD